ncbi:WAT1-related protein At4g08300-like isoform X2 [Salvia splendens]|nr:WAT1-related protein At4g08300-like isoform X2 [Salvia splendens]XP_042050888.1 WAT1-related protein At4g08300-like isoform X2 [Salvia splendens]XP_042050896.1 WAT1-related protein At4g08300-like isoform X2 [Salvia splendens]
MEYTFATFASATVNVLPAITFIMAVVFRLEKVKLKKVHSLAKVIGRLITVMGAMVIVEGCEEAQPQAKVAVMEDQKAGTKSDESMHSIGAQDPRKTRCTGFVSLGCIAGKNPANVKDHKLSYRDMAVQVIASDDVVQGPRSRHTLTEAATKQPQSTATSTGSPAPSCCFHVLWDGLPSLSYKTKRWRSIRLSCHCHLCLIGAGIIVVGLYSVVWGKSRERSAAHNSDNKHSYINDDQLPVSDMKTSDQIDHQTTPKSLHVAEP